MLGVTLGSQRLERLLHEKFKRYRVRGEWFLRSPEVEPFISRLTPLVLERKIMKAKKADIPNSVRCKAVPGERNYDVVDLDMPLVYRKNLYKSAAEAAAAALNGRNRYLVLEELGLTEKVE